jgi:hypothetical protein
LLDAFVDRDDVEVLPVVHEQCGVHVATLTTASPGGRWSSAPTSTNLGSRCPSATTGPGRLLERSTASA